MAARIILADDHRIIREGLSRLLSDHGYEVIAECDNGRDAVDKCINLKPDMVIMDVSMPELNGVEATRQLAREQPKTKILALSMQADSRYVFQMLKAGAAGYMLKDCEFKEMLTAMRAVLHGQTYLDSRVAGTVVKNFIGGEASLAQNNDNLTPREREIVQLLAEGKKTKEVAECLYISPKTVETHRRQIMHKLEFNSIAELTKYAIREGLTSADE